MYMHMLGENGVHWMNLVMNGLALLLFLTGAAVTLLQIKREREGAKEEEMRKLGSARNVLEHLLRGAVLRLVTDAQMSYGSGQGEIKKSAVLAEMMRLVPEQWRTLFDAETVGALIENGLSSAKEIWHLQ